MKFGSLHKIAAYVVAGLGLYSLTLGGELDGLALVLVLLSFFASWFADGPGILAPVWSRRWNLIVVIAFLVQAIRVLLTGDVLTRLVEFAAFLQITRLFSRRSAAEYQQIAVLAFLHLTAATVLSSEIAYGFAFLAFVIVAPWMLTLSHLRREIETHYPKTEQVDERLVVSVERVVQSRRVVSPAFLGGTAALSLPIFAMTAGLFLLFPRVGSGFLSFGGAGGRRVAGFGSNIELGGFGVIRDDPTVVLRVTPSPLGNPPRPSLGVKLRGTSFDFYDGHRWTRSISLAERVYAAGEETPLRRYGDPATDVSYRIVLDSIDEPVLFLPEHTVSFFLPLRMEAGHERARNVMRSTGLDLRYSLQDGGAITYSTWSDPSSDVEDAQMLDEYTRQALLSVPVGHERVIALAESVVRGTKDPIERAERIESYLKRQGHYRYTLEQPDTHGRLPLNVFLFEAKAGHCEYFATAMAIMLRAVGIPSRNVTGFSGGRFNSYGGYYAVRQGDAHSWVEAYVDGQGWVSFDPTPSGREEMGPTSGPFSALEEMLDALRTRWSTSVIGYDLRTQISTMQRLARWSARLGDSERGIGGSSWTTSRLHPSYRWLGVFVVLVVVAILARLAWRRMRRQGGHAEAVVIDANARAAIEIYRELERALLERGRPRPVATTPLAHAAHLRSDGFVGYESVQSVTERYIAARFGGEELAPAEQAELLERARSVRRPAPRA